MFRLNISKHIYIISKPNAQCVMLKFVSDSCDPTFDICIRISTAGKKASAFTSKHSFICNIKHFYFCMCSLFSHRFHLNQNEAWVNIMRYEQSTKVLQFLLVEFLSCTFLLERLHSHVLQLCTAPSLSGRMWDILTDGRQLPVKPQAVSTGVPQGMCVFSSPTLTERLWLYVLTCLHSVCYEPQHHIILYRFICMSSSERLKRWV